MPVEKFIRFTCDNCGGKVVISGDQPPAPTQQAEIERIIVATQGEQKFILCRPRCAANFFKLLADRSSPVAPGV